MVNNNLAASLETVSINPISATCHLPISKDGKWYCPVSNQVCKYASKTDSEGAKRCEDLKFFEVYMRILG
ncbi:hypothetical protein KA107_03060 [Candidatus Pacearchaeota archaeon]|nr:hypothetical protein [Candidatus Pacearchaeota archaeon]